MSIYTISNAAGLANIGLPAYMLGTWTHYNTTIGYARLGRVSGRGSKFASILVADMAKMIELGLMVPAV